MTPPPAMSERTRTVIALLEQQLGDRLQTGESVREQHSHDVSHHPRCPPDAVAFPESTDEVAVVVSQCAKHRVPIVPFGTGTAVEGGVLAVHGGVCIDLSRMNRILRVSDDDLDATPAPPSSAVCF